jgi:rRNA pseudouridine-1189 N-methylase Emg1 (Nep1/Mra1 family)
MQFHKHPSPSNNIKLITGQRDNLLVLFNNYKYNQNIKYASGEIKWRYDIIHLLLLITYYF